MASTSSYLESHKLDGKLDYLEQGYSLQDSPDQEVYKIVSLVPTRCCRVENPYTVPPVGPAGMSSIEPMSTYAKYACRLICISSDHSYRPLNMTRSTLQCLMTEHAIDPIFAEALSPFCLKILNIEESLCMPLQTVESATTFEYMYVFKYPERTHRPGDPSWSIRQTAFYHQVQLTEKKSTFAVVSPYKDSKGEDKTIEWFKALAPDLERSQRTFEANILLFETYVDAWRDYMTHYEGEVENLMVRLLNIGLKEKDGISADDITRLKFLERRLLPVEAALTTSQRLLDGLDRISQRGEVFGPKRCPARMKWAHHYSNYSNKIFAYIVNIRVLNQKCKNLTQLLDEIFNYKDQSAAKRQSATALFLTKKTVDDSATMKAVTNISVVFLSCTVTAAVIDMPIFYLNDSNVLTFSNSIWIYVGVAVALTALTLLYWRWTLRRQRMWRNKEMQMLNESPV